MRKLLGSFLALALCASVMLTGCQSTAGSMQEGAAGDGDVAVIDVYGREVSVPKEVSSVAVYGRGAARIIVYAGAVEKISGVSDMDKEADPWMPYAAVNADRFSELPSVGAGGSKDMAYDEAMIELAPDVIISTYGSDENSILQERLGIPIVGAKCQNMVFDEDLYKSIEFVGALLGTEESAERTVGYLKEFDEDLYERTRSLTDAERVSAYIGGVNYLGPRSLDGTFVHYDPFDAVGISNVLERSISTNSKGAFDIDLGMLRDWNPDFIFVNPLNISMIRETYQQYSSFLDTIPAIAEGRVYAQPAFNYNGTNVEMAVANAYYAGKVAYPDRFADVDMEAKTDEIFEALIGKPFYEELEEAGMGFSAVDIRG